MSMRVFGINLKRLRIERRLTQDELAQMLGVTGEFIYSLEEYIGYPGISLELFIEWCGVLNVTPNELLQETKMKIKFLID